MDNLSYSIMGLDDDVFQRIADLVYDRFGIHLTEKKRALVRGRLHSVVRSLELSSFEEYYHYLEEDERGDRLLQLIDRISTNHTYFFREADHFDYLADQVMPALLSDPERDQPVRIWCAGCASGEEPYTIAMVLTDAFGSDMAAQRIRILATDISMSALTAAEAGEYPAQKAAGVPKRFDRFFAREGTDRVRVSPTIRSQVLFKRLNLMRENYPFRNRFDIVFCRNVMIYFDQPTRARLLHRFHESMQPGSHLFIGHSETLGRDATLFRYVRPTIYSRT